MFRRLHLRGRHPSWAQVPSPSPPESGALPTVGVLGSQNPCTAPLPRPPASPQGSAEGTPEPRPGVTLTFPHHRLQPRGRHLPPRSTAASGLVPRWGRGPARHPRGPHPAGSGPTPCAPGPAPWSSDSLPASRKLGPSCSSLFRFEGRCTDGGSDRQSPVCVRPGGVLHGSAPLLTHIEISLLSATVEL